ncbi:MAG: hypothetical protein J6D52_01385 [Clostridia bacterium]|nr:hypothetical protein [Clostridia bacterium]
MFILTKSESELVNVDNVVSLYVESGFTGKTYIRARVGNSAETILLGEYTKEEAMQVFKALLFEIKTGNKSNCIEMSSLI